ncbi:MAG: ArnT family glycosyltransferase, partial [Crocinitomicaceae bacterium]
NYASGKSAGEFPIMYYVVGKFWSIFDVSYWSYRLFYLAIIFLGLFSLFKSLQLLIKDNFWAISLPFLLFTSPVFAYYGVSFLTDIPSISFVLIALYFFTRYQFHGRSLFFWFSMLFFALAGLIKISSLIVFVFLGAVLVLETVSKFKTLRERKLFQKLKIEWIGFSAVLIVIFGWYYYASMYNTQHGFKYTFNAIHPLWKMGYEEGTQVMSKITDFSSMIFFSRPMLWLLLFVGLFNAINFKGQTLFGWLANVTIAIGVAVYALFWFPLLGGHNYYWGAMTVIVLSTLIPLLLYLKERFSSVLSSKKLKVLFSVFLLLNFMYCSSIINLKKFSQEGLYPVVGNHQTVGLLQWFNFDHQTNMMRYDRMKPYLTEIGISENDKVITMNDESFNSTLFLMNRKGWTGFVPLTDELMQDYIASGASYLFVDTPESLELEFMQPYLQKPVGDFENVKIFSLK